MTVFRRYLQLLRADVELREMGPERFARETLPGRIIKFAEARQYIAGVHGIAFTKHSPNIPEQTDFLRRGLLHAAKPRGNIQR